MVTKSKPWELKVWKEEKNKIIDENSKCYFCNSKKDLVIHHTTKNYNKYNFSKYAELKDKNIIILCKKCHFIFHKYNKRLCQVCKKNYHNLGFLNCFNCKQKYNLYFNCKGELMKKIKNRR